MSLISNDDVRATAIGCIDQPNSEFAVTNFVTIVKQHDDELGAELAAFTQTGRTNEGAILADYELLTPQWQLLRVLDNHDIIRFAYECSNLLLPALNSRFPSEQSWMEVIDAIDTYLRDSSSRHDLEQKIRGLQYFASEISNEWDNAHMNGEFDENSKEEIRNMYLPIVGVNCVLTTGRTALAKSREGVLSCADSQLLSILEFVGGAPQNARTQQLEALDRIVRNQSMET